MEIAKISSKGQITIPISVRNRLHLNTGDKVLILEENGRFYIENNKINFNLSSVEYLLKFGNLTAYFTNFSNFYKRYFIVSKRGA